MRKFRSLFTLLLLLCLASHVNAQDTPSGTVIITAPIDGGQVFGLLEIVGTASHPDLFDGYTLEWSNAQNAEVWLPIQPAINQQVSNGILGQWDTAAGIPDGTYQIRLRMFLTDGSVQDFVVRNLVVVNSTPTDIPTAASPIIAPTLPALPTAGITPTPLILQPPTVTPRPTFEQPLTGESSPESGGTDSSENTIVNFDALQGAICNGAYFTFVLFGIIIGYLLLRRQISPYTRRLWWQIRSEIDSDRSDY